MGNVAAMKNRTLLHPEARAEILRRIEPLTPRSERRWGRMTPHQMVCHLSDACRAALGDRRVPVIGTLWERTVITWLAIHTNVKWPQSVRTVPEADQEIGGTRPTEFARDVDELRGLIQRLVARKRSSQDTIRCLAPCRQRNGADSVTVMRIIIFVNSVPRKRAISRFVGPSSACCFAVSRRMCE
jgi:hypothetical protein